MLRRYNLNVPTVVITGASSGIGRGTALAFAREKYNLVLAARSKETLKELAEECIKLGARAYVVPTDVTSAIAVKELAQKAANKYNGRIDIWVNDAGLGAVGGYEEVPMESHAQVVAVNLVGYMNGAHAVIPYFKKQRTGTMINMNSLGAYIPSPYAASYTASKFGLRGFMDSLRAELRNFPDIHVCDVYPSFVNSPGMSHGANYTGVEVSPVPPTVSAHKVAATIVELSKHPQPTQMVGFTARLGRIVGPHFPGLFASLLGSVIEYHMKHGKKTAHTDGNLFEHTPKETSTVEGHYGNKKKVIASVAAIGAIAGLSYYAYKKTQPQISNQIQH